MRLLDSAAIGHRIALARTRSGLTQSQLAAEINIDRSALAKIESGTRRVSALELAQVANIVGERVEWFVTEPPSAIVSYRNTQEPGAPDALIDRTLERVARNVEFVLDHDSELTMPDLAPLTRPRSSADVEAQAEETRGLLGLDRTEPFVDMSRQLSRIGLLTFVFDLGNEVADAASLLLERGGIAIVNGNLKVGRRRLALAHELGHFIFADEYTVDWRVDERNVEVWEARLDRFARAVLLPTKGVTEQWRQLITQDGVRTAAVKIASRFQVDMSTLSRRLSELSLVDGNGAGFIRSVRTTRADIVDFDLVPRDELRPVTLAKAYEAAVLRMFRNETVSPARATDLLFDSWEENELPELPRLPENAIWKFVG
ncbi:MAG TPA: XRE family transcriptional regulator [Actinokineospora sp.]|jgi:Zn-dependent peptidase ImmA (M78 family)/DNA-binding XRE family transcriptional regulator|nr:XRE family transcriptional regulator [Actinokineospora sp.]